MEHSDRRLEQDPPQAFSLFGEHFHAPASLLVKLEDRQALYDLIRSSQISEHDLMAAAQHEQWEIRSAAVEALGREGGENAYALIVNALQDENHFVRMTAVQTLGKRGDQAPLPILFAALQDHNWQVREIAVLTLGELSVSIPEETREMLLHDSNSNVREAIKMVIQTNHVSEASHVSLSLSHALVHATNTQRKTLEGRSKPDMATVLESRNVISRSQRAFPWKWRIILIAASLTFLVILTAASVISGWWNPRFGDPNLYQTLGQQRVSQGITIKVTKAYADEGRTIIAYDISSQNPGQSVLVMAYDLTSVTPQNHEILTNIECDAPQSGLSHCYMIQPSFRVPAGINKLDLDWNVTQVMINGKRSFIAGTWHFAFSVPFHHENQQSLPDPIHNGVML